MLRTLGIPARVAVGFSLDDSNFDEETKTYVLSERDSWAWPEVYFPGFGWVEFNPTPVRDVVNRPGPDVVPIFGPGAGSDLEDLPIDLVDLLDELDEQIRLLEEARREGLAQEFGSGGGSSIGPAQMIGWLIALIAAAAVVVLVGVALGLLLPRPRSRHRPLGGDPAPLRLGRRQRGGPPHAPRGGRRAQARPRGGRAGRAARNHLHPRALRRERRSHRGGRRSGRRGCRVWTRQRRLSAPAQPAVPRDAAAPARAQAGLPLAPGSRALSGPPGRPRPASAPAPRARSRSVPGRGSRSRRRG